MCQKKAAFTLVELLVVIAIIALLLSILLPSLNAAREQARGVVCQSRLKTLAMSNMTYAAGHDDEFVPWSQKPTVDRTGSPMPYDERWPENRDFRHIMWVDKKIVDDGGWNSAFIWTKTNLCPTYPDPSGKLFEWNGTQYVGYMTGWVTNICYGYNTERWAMDASFWPGDGKTRGFRSSNIKNSSGAMMFVDASFYQVRRYQADWKRYWDVYKDTYKPWNPNNPPMYAQTAYRHKKGANVAYFDGHVAYRKEAEVYDRINNPTPSTTSPFYRKYDPLWDVFGRLPMMR